MSVVAVAQPPVMSAADSSSLPSLLSVPLLPRQQRRNSKVQITISDSCVSLGWWMVMSEDEQGYAPAAYLEPMEEKNQDQLVDSTSSEGVF